jgi:hypothetical protein
MFIFMFMVQMYPDDPLSFGTVKNGEVANTMAGRSGEFLPPETSAGAVSSP